MKPRQLYWPLDDRDARQRLPERPWAYQWRIARGQYLAYEKAPGKPPYWVARYKIRGTVRRYRTHRLGIADDQRRANGVRVLTFRQALDSARAWIESYAHETIPTAFPTTPERLIYTPWGPVYTIGHAIVDYLKFTLRYRRSGSVVFHRANLDILPHIGTIGIDELTSERLRDWLATLAARPSLKYKGPATAESVRARRMTANNVFSLLCCALNMAFREGKAKSDLAWKRVQRFRGVQKARERFLSEKECRRLVAVAPAEASNLILGALYSGCRLGELVAMPRNAFDADLGKLFVAPGKSGQHRWIVLSPEAIRFFSSLSREGRSAGFMFVRRSGLPWQKHAAYYAMRTASAAAGILPAAGFHTLRHTYASLLVRGGASLLAVSRQLGHADIRPTIRCYAHVGHDYVAEVLRDRFPRYARASQSSRDWQRAANEEYASRLPLPTLLGLGVRNSPAILRGRSGGNSIPVFAAYKGDDGFWRLPAEPAGHLETGAAAREAFAIRVSTEGMFPLCRPGDLVVLGQDGRPDEGRPAALIAYDRRGGRYLTLLWRLTRSSARQWSGVQLDLVEASFSRASWRTAHRVLGMSFAAS